MHELEKKMKPLPDGFKAHGSFLSHFPIGTGIFSGSTGKAGKNEKKLLARLQDKHFPQFLFCRNEWQLSRNK